MGVRIKRSLPGLGVVRSAAISMRHVFERKMTVQYPDEAPAVGSASAAATSSTRTSASAAPSASGSAR